MSDPTPQEAVAEMLHRLKEKDQEIARLKDYYDKCNKNDIRINDNLHTEVKRLRAVLEKIELRSHNIQEAHEIARKALGREISEKDSFITLLEKADLVTLHIRDEKIGLGRDMVAMLIEGLKLLPETLEEK